MPAVGVRMNIRGNAELESYLESLTGKSEFQASDVERELERKANIEEMSARMDKNQPRTETVRFETTKKKKGKMKEHEILNDGYVGRNDNTVISKKEQRKGEKGRQKEKEKKNKTKAINREKKAVAKSRNFVDD